MIIQRKIIHKIEVISIIKGEDEVDNGNSKGNELKMRDKKKYMREVENEVEELRRFFHIMRRQVKWA